MNVAPARTSATRWSAHLAAPFLYRLDELERHGQAGLSGIRPLRHTLAEPDGGECGVDPGGGSQMDPVLDRGRRRTARSVSSSAGTSLVALGYGGENPREGVYGLDGSRAGLRGVDRGKGGLGLGVQAFGKGVHDRWPSCGPVGALTHDYQATHPTPLLGGARETPRPGPPRIRRSVADGYRRGG